MKKSVCFLCIFMFFMSCFNGTKINNKINANNSNTLLNKIRNSKCNVFIYFGELKIKDSFYVIGINGDVKKEKIYKLLLTKGDTFYNKNNSFLNLNGNFIDINLVNKDSFKCINVNKLPLIKWDVTSLFLDMNNELFQFAKVHYNTNINNIIKKILEHNNAFSLFSYLDQFLINGPETEHVYIHLLPLLTSISDDELSNVLKKLNTEEIKTIKSTLFYSGYGISSDINIRYFQDNFIKSYNFIMKF